MVKPLAFKGDKPKKRKRAHAEDAGNDGPAPPSKQEVLAAPGARVGDGDGDDDDENWVSADALGDISGPIMLVSSTKTPTSLSVDQLGRVFAQKIENVVEGLPESAEPHDVRQVWIATRVVGSENEFTFKGHHGRYLGCDKYGTCSATREAVSPEETFTVHAVEGVASQFDIQAGRSSFISVTDADEGLPEVRGDADTISDATHVRIRMQARFKPKHKVEKAEKVRSKISRKELEDEVGRRLDDGEVKLLKKARRVGNYHEAMLDVKVKGKHDKFA